MRGRGTVVVQRLLDLHLSEAQLDVAEVGLALRRREQPSALVASFGVRRLGWRAAGEGAAWWRRGRARAMSLKS